MRQDLLPTRPNSHCGPDPCSVHFGTNPIPDPESNSGPDPGPYACTNFSAVHLGSNPGTNHR